MPDSPFADLDRPPLSETALRKALIRPGGLWTSLSVVPETGSTNADLARAAQSGTAAAGTVLIAESQVAGRGRMDRVWTTPPRAGLTFSMLFRPEVPPARLGWLPLLLGLSAASAVRRIAELDVQLKWPNDLLVGERKLAGILAERAGEFIVAGIGLNVSTRAEELPPAPLTPTSLALEEAACVDRDPVLRTILREIESHYGDWAQARGDADASGLRTAYRAFSATIGQDIRVELPAGRFLTGRATGVDEAGCLLVAEPGGQTHAVSAGDVVHVRPHSG